MEARWTSIPLNARAVTARAGAQAKHGVRRAGVAGRWQQQGKTAEAHQLLSEIYNWFTEGFDTKDLKEAKALLEELAA